MFHAQMRILVLSQSSYKLDVLKFKTVSWSSIVCNLTACHISFSSEDTFPPSHHCEEVFPAGLCAVCPWSSFVVLPRSIAFVRLPQSVIQRKVSEARSVLLCLALRCYLPSSQMQLAPSASLSCFVWREDSSENQGRPHT